MQISFIVMLFLLPMILSSVHLIISSHSLMLNLSQSFPPQTACIPESFGLFTINEKCGIASVLVELEQVSDCLIVIRLSH